MAIIINKNIPGFKDKNMVVLKGYLYTKHWEWVDPTTGEVSEGNRYLTLFTMIPIEEFKTPIEIIHNRPMTHGVYVSVIGSMEGIVPTTLKVGLRNYQDHLEGLGWKFVQTIPDAKGNNYETVRATAYSIMRQIEKGGDYKQKWNILRENIEKSLNKAIDTETVLALRKVLDDMWSIEYTKIN